jgi:DNA-binding transcriptional ArsR family regulator
VSFSIASIAPLVNNWQADALTGARGRCVPGIDVVGAPTPRTLRKIEVWDAPGWGRTPSMATTDLPPASSRPRGRSGWRFLTNHGIVTLIIAQDPHVRMTEIAERTGLSRRAVQMIVTDLAEGGFITRRRIGRRNIYTLNADRPGRDLGRLDPDPTLRSLLRILGDSRRPLPADNGGSRRASVSWAASRAG